MRPIVNDQWPWDLVTAKTSFMMNYVVYEERGADVKLSVTTARKNMRENKKENKRGGSNILRSLL